MNEQERGTILKAALLLALLEGWTAPVSVRARLGVDVDEALGWLWRNHYIEASEHDGVRWLPHQTFEQLWARLMPHRGCPVRLCGGALRGSHSKELR